MNSKIIIVTEKTTWIDVEIDQNILSRKGLFKSLSLLLADRSGITIPSTLLMLSNKINELDSFLKKWNFPLMIRMDYQTLIGKKLIGGIPIYKKGTMVKLSNFLFINNYVPIFHPDIDRHKDEYSVGVLMNKDDHSVIIEVVGEGFDAGDLRLGKTIPHETIKIDVLKAKILERKIISSIHYERACESRKRWIFKLNKYTSYANKYAVLLSDLDELLNDQNDISLKGISFPENYLPLSPYRIERLVSIVWDIKTHILHQLPHSNSYVASLSYLPEHEWILWDIYGSWYKR